MSSLRLGKRGKEIIEKYAEILGIALEDAIKIFERNKLAKGYIQSELGLRMQSIDTSLSMMLKATIFRDGNDRSKITEEEIKKVKEYYKINIKKEDRTISFVNGSRRFRIFKGKINNNYIKERYRINENEKNKEEIKKVFSNLKKQNKTVSSIDSIKRYC